jgi:ribosomal protein S12 methylthiotransferase
MIVGFPGETDREFEELCQFVEAAQFDRLGVFAYSDQETSASFQLEGKVDKRTIYNRRRSLMALQRRISRKHNRRLIGHECQVLVEGPSKETELLWEARLSTQAPEIDGVCYINNFGSDDIAPRPGEMRSLRVTEAHDYDLVGELIDSPEPNVASGVEEIANPFRILQIQPQSAPAFGAIPAR